MRRGELTSDWVRQFIRSRGGLLYVTERITIVG
jgi:hypothetical protein